MAESIQIPRTPAYTARLTKEFNRLRSEAELTDIRIQSETRSYSCHKVILTANSPFIKAKLRFDASESPRNEVDLKHIPSDVVEMILEYMYTGEVSIPRDRLQPVVEASDYLEMLELKEFCLSKAVLVFKPSNAISWYRLADKLDIESLRSQLSEIISSSLAEIAKYSEFLELSTAEMNSFISGAQETDADPDDMLGAMLSWLDHKADQRIDCMQDLLEKFDLARCSLECLETESENHQALLKRHPEGQNVLIAKHGAGNMKRRIKTVDKSKVVIVGGRNEDGLNTTCWEMYYAPMEFLELCQIPEHPGVFAACKTPGGFVLTGGEGCVLCSRFVLFAKSWVPLEPLPFPRYCHGSIFMNGRIFVFGGIVSAGWSYRVQSLELDGGRWSDEPDMPVTLGFPEAASVDNSIFMIDRIEKDDLLQFDLETRIWSRKAKLPWGSCLGAKMVAVGGRLLVAGGNGRIFGQYNPGTDTWTTGSTPVYPHLNGALVHCGGRKLYLMGGNQEDRVEEYDLDTKAWSGCDTKLPKKLSFLHALDLDV